ncbi:hypothetical protein NPX13_g1221 [Xylaria arbuscula]|uniref:Uncharacterized protein n=1 Tax=Xylaria arbuscula TaxID=114810 RepID=A0A9W8NMU2_9PEZI|nr:hypothetical protein NPX13_g1221 [Xylaria arbuscula]
MSNLPLIGHGDDSIQAGKDFVLSLYGTDSVFTAVNDDLRIKTYSNSWNQIWECVKDQNNQCGLKSRGTAKFLGRDQWGHLACFAPRQSYWEYITLTKAATGGYRFFVLVDRKLCTIEQVSDPNGPYMQVVSDSRQMIGLHQHPPPPFERFFWVIPHRLARSSAPHYRSADSDQKMDEEAIQYLEHHQITGIISLNQFRLPQKAVDQLRARGIKYDHIPVVDFAAPTLQQLYQLRDYYQSQTCSLI